MGIKSIIGKLRGEGKNTVRLVDETDAAEVAQLLATIRDMQPKPRFIWIADVLYDMAKEADANHFRLICQRTGQIVTNRKARRARRSIMRAMR